MPICPTCGSTTGQCPCGIQDDSVIASWLDGGPVTIEQPSEAGGQACTACGYSGTMNEDLRGTSCLACGVVLVTRKLDVPPRVTRQIECPECGCRIGITAEDEGRTVVCPGCSCFLGTPLAKPGAGRKR
jgi:hypothetical protein